MGKKKSPPKQALRASNLAYPSPPTGQGRQTGAAGYPPPQTAGWDLGLSNASHNGSNYPQPNSANQPDPSSTAPPAGTPDSSAYRPNLAGNTLPESMGNPGVISGDEPPDYP